MHYKNGRPAKNGDKVVHIQEWTNNGVVQRSLVVGILYDAVAGNDYCNGHLAPISSSHHCPNLKECLHLDDFLTAFPTDFPDTSRDKGTS